MPKNSAGSTVTALLALAAAMVHCSPRIPTGSGGDGGSGGSDGGNGSGQGGVGATGFNFGGSGGERPSGGPIDGGCAASTEEGVQIPANLMFVVDRSGSMNCCPPPVTSSERCEVFPTKEGCTDSKWDITRDALVGAIDGLRALGNISVGVTMFPTDHACGFPTEPDVDIAPLDDAHFSSVQTFLDGVTPNGKTPLAGATLETYAYLQDTFQTRLTTENTFVVVVTDGADTCAPSEMDRLVDELAEAAHNINIRTFVIGAPGSDPARLQLSKLAALGGTGTSTCDYGQNGGGSVTDAGGSGGTGGSPGTGNYCHFDMTTATDFAGELAAALDAISQSKELSCEFDVPTNPDGRKADLDAVNVTVTSSGEASESVLQDTTAACDQGAEGWQYNDDQTKILLCGSVCDRVQADRGAQVEIVLGCPTEKLIR